MKYLGERRRHWIERAFWIIAFFVSLFGCAVLILNIYEKWQLSPVIVSFAEKSTPVWQIPFPAVTICPETKAMAEHVKFTRAYHILKANASREAWNLTDTEVRNMEALAQVCDPHLFESQEIDGGLKSNEIVPLLKNITMSLNETTLFCKWRNEIADCDKFFQEVITEEGYCFSFNLLDFPEMFRQDV